MPEQHILPVESILYTRTRLQSHVMSLSRPAPAKWYTQARGQAWQDGRMRILWQTGWEPQVANRGCTDSRAEQGESWFDSSRSCHVPTVLRHWLLSQKHGQSKQTNKHVSSKTGGAIIKRSSLPLIRRPVNLCW
jgi:hypothetical protein